MNQEGPQGSRPLKLTSFASSEVLRAFGAIFTRPDGPTKVLRQKHQGTAKFETFRKREDAFLGTNSDRLTKLRNLRISYLEFVPLFDESKAYLSSLDSAIA